MYSVCKEIHGPTGVELVTYCYFFDRREKNLVVAGANSIRVFRFVQDFSDPNVSNGKCKMQSLRKRLIRFIQHLTHNNS